VDPTREPGRFFALVPLPEDTAPREVTYLITDRAHNRTSMTVEVDGREGAGDAPLHP
jgi:hypothetical protein